MIKIALCDDDQNMLGKLYYYIEKSFIDYKIDIEIHTYNTPHNFIDNYKNNIYDFIFLDIHMKPIDGFEIAKYINDNNSEAKIVFVTNHDNIVYDCFEYLPIGFIRKSNLEKDFLKCINTIITKYSHLYKYIYGDNKNIDKIYLSDIYYIINDKNYLNIKVKNNENIKVRKTFKSLLNEINSDIILQINKGIVVNVTYIQKIEKFNLILDNEEMLIISRNYIDNLKKKYFQYLRR